MTPEQFAYWLQGYAELNQMVPSYEQWKSICEHLNTVFKKETPKVVFPAGLGNREIKPGGEPAKTLPEMIRETERLGQGVFDPSRTTC